MPLSLYLSKIKWMYIGHIFVRKHNMLHVHRILSVRGIRLQFFVLRLKICPELSIEKLSN